MSSRGPQVQCGRLAQLGERQLDMLEVGGSKPSPPTTGMAAGRAQGGFTKITFRGQSIRLARSSSGLGRHPFKVDIRSSNLLRVTRRKAQEAGVAQW